VKDTSSKMFIVGKITNKEIRKEENWETGKKIIKNGSQKDITINRGQNKGERGVDVLREWSNVILRGGG
jgi:hypothetical protein